MKDAYARGWPGAVPADNGWLDGIDADGAWDGEDGEDPRWDEDAEIDDVEWDLPLGAENFTTGEPLVGVDYYDLAPANGETTQEKLLALPGTVRDEGARRARILIFDQCAHEDRLDLRALIAIASVRGDTLRVATARAVHADPVRDAVLGALGASARHRERTRENPIEAYLNGD